MKSDSATLQAAVDSPIDLPPDSYAAHIADLPVPGSRVLKSQSALAAALAYNALDPDQRQFTINLVDDMCKLAEQNETLEAYSRNIYAYAMKLKDDLARVVAANEKGISELKQMNATLGTSGSASESEIARLNGTIDKLKARLVEVKTEAEEKTSHVESLLARHADRSEEAAKLRIQVAELEDRLKDGKTAHGHLVDEVNSFKSQLETAQRQFEDLKTHVTELTSERDRELERVNSAHETEMNDLKAEFERVTSSERDVRTRNKDIEAEVSNLRNELSSGKQAHDEALERLESERAKLRRIEDVLDGRVRECNTLKDTLAASQKACDDWKSKLESATDAAAKQVAGVQAELDAAHKHANDRETTFAQEAEEARQVLEGLNEDLASSRREATAWKSKLEQADAAAQDRGKMESELEVMRAKAESNESKLKLAIRERDDALNENRSLEQRIDGLKSKLQAAKAAVRERKHEVSSRAQSSIAECDGLRGQISKLRDELSDAQKKNQEQEKTIKTLTAERDSIRWERDTKNTLHIQQSSSLNQQLLTAQRQAQTATEKLDEMTKQMQLQDFELQSKISHLLRCLEDARCANETDCRRVAESSPQTQQKIRELEDELWAARREVAKLTAQIAGRREADRASYPTHFDAEDLRVSLAKKEQEVDDLRSENDRLCTEIDELSKESEKVAALTAQLEHEREVAKGDNTTLTGQVKLLKNQCESAKAELDELKDRLQKRADFATEESGRFSAEAARLNELVHARENDISAWKEECARLDAMVERLRRQVDEQKDFIERNRHYYGWR